MSLDISLPVNYGDNKIVLMVRDPWTLFAYWEVQREVEDEVSDMVHCKGFVVSKNVLRIYDVTEATEGPDASIGTYIDLDLKVWTESWYVHTVLPGRKWMASVGVLCTTGDFFEFTRSNIVKTPVSGKVSADGTNADADSYQMQINKWKL
jgi:uncharacterized protein